MQTVSDHREITIANTMDVIRGLRDQGFRIRINHRRIMANRVQPTDWYYLAYHDNIGERRNLTAVRGEVKQKNEVWNPSSVGGFTEVSIIHPDTGKEYRGEAVCCMRDNFNKKIGLHIAFVRAYREIYG